MIVTLAAIGLFASGLQPPPEAERPEPPQTEAQQAEDRANEVTEGERSGDGGNLDRVICDWRRVQGSNRRERVCQTVGDRRATRDQARDTIQRLQGSRTDPAG